jgi:hypothetical protein
MKLNSDDWSNICQRVTTIALPIFKIPFPLRVKSSMLSALFEIEAAKYYNEQGIPVRNAQTDFEPDLIFLENNTILEIKVTKKSKTNRFRGNKVSKNDSHYILIVWDETPELHNLYEEYRPPSMSFKVIHSYIKQSEWDKECSNYNASFLSVDHLSDSTVLVESEYNCKNIQ